MEARSRITIHDAHDHLPRYLTFFPRVGYDSYLQYKTPSKLNMNLNLNFMLSTLGMDCFYQALYTLKSNSIMPQCHLPSTQK